MSIPEADPITLLFLPEKLIKSLAQNSADRGAEPDRRIIISFFNCVDRLTGDSYEIGELLLREVLRGSGRLHSQIFHESSLLFSLAF